MNIGLYHLKYPARKLMGWLLPYLGRIDPNWVSLSLLPVGAAAAWAYGTGHYLAGVGFLLLRMFLGTLDGLIAEHFKKGTRKGEILNRLAPEVCDSMLFATLAIQWPLWGVLALCTCWLTTFTGLVGLSVNRPIQSIGPAGQTDRLAALILCSLLSQLPADIDWMRIFLIWCTFGGIATIYLRLKRTLTAGG